MSSVVLSSELDPATTANAELLRNNLRLIQAGLKVPRLPFRHPRASLECGDQDSNLDARVIQVKP
jgi:hypothetical protein